MKSNSYFSELNNLDFKEFIRVDNHTTFNTELNTSSLHVEAETTSSTQYISK